MKKLSLLLLSTIILISCNKKTEKIVDKTNFSSEEKIDSTKIKTLFNSALTQGQSYE